MGALVRQFFQQHLLLPPGIETSRLFRAPFPASLRVEVRLFFCWLRVELSDYLACTRPWGPMPMHAKKKKRLAYLSSFLSFLSSFMTGPCFLAQAGFDLATLLNTEVTGLFFHVLSISIVLFASVLGAIK